MPCHPHVRGAFVGVGVFRMSVKSLFGLVNTFGHEV